jgi:hypothetical protein
MIIQYVHQFTDNHINVYITVTYLHHLWVLSLFVRPFLDPSKHWVTIQAKNCVANTIGPYVYDWFLSGLIVTRLRYYGGLCVSG